MRLRRTNRAGGGGTATFRRMTCVLMRTRRAFNRRASRRGHNRTSRFAPVPRRGDHRVRMIRTGAEYLESVRDGRRVLCEGELIDDITTHPKTRGYAQALAEYYDLHHDPAHQEISTFVDEDGERWAKHWMLPRNKEELVERRLVSRLGLPDVGARRDVHAPAGQHAAGLLHAVPGSGALGGDVQVP